MKKVKICGIYKITSPSEKVYIGQSEDINKRKKSYKNTSCVGQTKIYNSLKKYGWEYHIFEIIEECSVEDLNCRERYWQDFYDVLGENGLNLVLQECGELRTKISESTRQKMSTFHKGKVISEDMKNKLSVANRGENNAMYGLRGENHPASKHKPTEEQKKKQVETFRANLTSERLEAMSERMKGENNPMFGKGFKGSQNPMYGKAGELNSNSDIFINLETGIFYFGKVEVAASFSHITFNMVKNMLDGRDLNKTSVVKVDDYLNGTAKYNEQRQLRKVINIDTKEIFDSMNIVSKLFNIEKTKLRNMLGKTCKNKTPFIFLEDYDPSFSDKRYVLDLNTGVYYNSISEASRYVNIGYGTLRKLLLNDAINSTSLIYV